MTTSNMPPAEEVAAEHTMMIHRVRVNDHPSKNVRTFLDRTIRNTATEQPRLKWEGLYVQLYEVSDARTNGYLPAKAWITGLTDDDQPKIEMSFYVTPSLPPAARAFGDGPMYVFATAVDSNETIEYDVQARVFVDHIMHEGVCWYVFTFGKQTYDMIINPEDGDVV